MAAHDPRRWRSRLRQRKTAHPGRIRLGRRYGTRRRFGLGRVSPGAYENAPRKKSATPSLAA